MIEDTPSEIVLENGQENLRFEYLEEREGVKDHALYDLENKIDPFSLEMFDEWIVREEDGSHIYSGVYSGSSETLENAVLEYDPMEETAGLLIFDDDPERKEMETYSEKPEGVLNDTSPR